MGIFCRKSNHRLRYGGAVFPAGITRVAVVGTEFWGYLSAKRRENSNTGAGRQVWHFTDTLSLPGCRVSVGMVNCSRDTVIVSQVEQKWSQAAHKGGHEGCGRRAFLSSKVRGGHKKGQ